MKTLTLLILFIVAETTFAQINDDRYLISVGNLGADLENVLIAGDISFVTVRRVQRPDLGLNFLAAIVPPAEINQARAVIANAFAPNYVFDNDPVSTPSAAGGTGAVLCSPVTPNDPLIDLVPSGPITTPTTSELTADIIVDIMGTGIDTSHADLSSMTFEPGLSVIPDSGVGYLNPNFDFNDHETRIAGCIGGTTSGLLTYLGTTGSAKFRSVLFYDKPYGGTPIAYVSDALAAVIEVTDNHKIRLADPYLKNHGAVMCFSHSLESANTRVGDLEMLLDEAWELGIFTSISAGNSADTAAARSPAGTGEWVTYDSGGIVNVRYWPPSGIYTYSLPSAVPVGFKTTFAGYDYHLKTGGHDSAATPAVWYVGVGDGSNTNTANPSGLTPATNNGVDLFAPSTTVPVPATIISDPPAVATTVTEDTITYGVERGYLSAAGTSYSAAYSAALATRLLQLRPWASPEQIRTEILAASTAASTGHPSVPILAVPSLPGLAAMKLKYADWIARYVSITDEISPGYFSAGKDGKLEDPDGDGVVNLVEYLCGMDPRHDDSSLAPIFEVDPDLLTLTATMQLASYLNTTDGADWEIESSTDLDTWTSLGQGTVSDLGEGTGDGRLISGTQSFTLGSGDKFFRLKVYSTPVTP